jgi:hypothetical protein
MLKKIPFYYKVVNLHLEKKNQALAPTYNMHKVGEMPTTKGRKTS